MSVRTGIAMLIASLLFSSLPTLAQVRRTTVPGHPRQEPCWQVAGISKTALEERQALARETRAQVEAVCTDSSLTPQQKRQQIREIHQTAKEKSEALVTPQQQEELQACQKGRSTGHPARMGAPHPAGTGPCGEALSGPKPPVPGSTGNGPNNPPSEEGEETVPQ